MVDTREYGESEPPARLDQASDAWHPGAVLGRYQLTRKIGEGGMAAVFEGSHVDLGKRVAIKVLLPAAAANPNVRDRFVREGRAASKIHHPHVVDVTDVGTQGATAFLVMEYLEGESLGALLERDGRLAPRAAVELMLPVLAAVVAVHAEGIVHRDLKPDNIFLARTRDGHLHPKVLDFGISRLVDTSQHPRLTATNTLIGTPAYMAPEQVRKSAHVDSRCDQFSLGVVLYECLTGQNPFLRDGLFEIFEAIVRGEVPPPRALVEDLPEGLEQAVLRAMRVDPEERFPTVGDLARELLPFAPSTVRAHWVPVFGPPSVATATTLPAPPMPAERGPSTPASEPVAPRTVPAVAPPDPSAPSPTPARWALVALGVLALGLVAVFALRPSTSPGPGPAPSSLHPSGSVAPLATPLAPPLLAPSPPPRLETYQVSIVVQPAAASLTLDGQPAGTGSLERTFPRDGAEHTLRIEAEGHEPEALTFHDLLARAVTLQPSRPSPAQVRARPRPAAGRRSGSNAMPLLR